MTSEEITKKYPRLEGLKSPCTADGYIFLHKILNEVLERHNCNLKDVSKNKSNTKVTELQSKVIKDFDREFRSSVLYSYDTSAMFFNCNDDRYRYILEH